MNSKINDEVLMAYADGELDAAQATQVEQAMQNDASVAARVAQHRALRAKLLTGFNDVLSEPVPQRLLDSLRAPSSAKIVDLAQLKQRKSGADKWSHRQWGAMAASLIAGIVIGMYALNFNSKQLISEQDGALIAQGTLSDVLTTQLASDTDQAIQIGISFRNRAGQYCRSFAVTAERLLAGLACREQEQWRVQMLTEAGNDASEFRQAESAVPAAVLALIEQQIAGEPLDAEAEATAQQGGWR